jgi:hypothetical protein
MSYIASASAIEESGLTTEDIPGVMIAVASVVGAPRVTTAGRHVLKAPDLAIAVADAELAGQIESSNSSPAGAG